MKGMFSFLEHIRFFETALKTFLICLILMVIENTGIAQNYEWAKSISSGTTISSYTIATDTSGNVYIGGKFGGTVDFDPGPGIQNLTSAGDYDMFFAKYDASGNYLWANRVGGSNWDQITDIVLDDVGNVHATGYFQKTVDFDPGTGTQYLTAAGLPAMNEFDAFFAKYDTGGNYIWAKRLGAGPSEFSNAIDLDNSGNIYLTGVFALTVDFDPGPGTQNLTSVGNGDPFFAKYDSNGDYIWAKNINGTGQGTGIGLTVDGSGNVIITGDFLDTADFDPGTGTQNIISNNDESIFIAKYNTNGDYLWAHGFGSGIDNAGRSVVTDTSGNVYVTGQFRDTIDFDPSGGIQNLISAGSNDCFLAKYDSNGNYVWAHAVGGFFSDMGTDVTTDDSSNVFITGGFSSTVDFDPSSGINNLTIAGASDIFLAKYDVDGNYRWAHGFGGAFGDFGNDVLVDHSGNILLTGFFNDTVDFDPGIGTQNLIADGGQSTFFAKYSTVVNCSTLVQSITQQEVLCNGDNSGSATSNVSGGTPPYTYNWSEGTTTAMADSLMAGTYIISIDDNAGCSLSDSITITEPPALDLLDTSNTPSTCGYSNGSACVWITGGIPPYVLIWDDSNTTVGACIDSVFSGTYNPVLSDGNGCQYTEAIVVSCINSIPSKGDNVEKKLVVYPNPVTGELTFKFESRQNRLITIYCLSGKKIATYILKGIEDVIEVKELAKGSYFYRIQTLGNNEPIGRGIFIKE